MIERLRRALEHVDELPEVIQDELAEQIEDLLAPDQPLPSLPAGSPEALNGTDGDFDQMIEDLDRIRHGTRVAPPVKGQS